MSLFPGKGKYEVEEQDNLGVDWVIHYQFDDLGWLATHCFFPWILLLTRPSLQTNPRLLTTSAPSFMISSLPVSRLRFVMATGRPFSSVFASLETGWGIWSTRRGRCPPQLAMTCLISISRVKDWLFAISHSLPAGDDMTIVEADTPSEELRSIYHALTWQKELGGAEITPGCGRWKHVTSAFPLHNRSANTELFRKWSRTTGLTSGDLDTIRALFGEEVAFYFAFIHSYSVFLIFPAVWGVICWLYFGPYSITCAVVNCLWCVVFVEYWKMRETDLSLRWGVKGVGALKVDRPQYVWDKEVADPITGQVQRVFSVRKQLLRQLLLIPFASVATIALGTLIVVAFAMEVFISEVYTGPFKGYLEFLPTVLFSLSLPAITTLLNNMATRLTDFENYRTQDQYDLAQTQKTFVMNFITSFLPTLLTAFIYVPFGQKIVPYLNIFRVAGLSSSTRDFRVDSTRLQQEVIYLCVTGQVFNFGEEFVLPYVKRVLWQKWRDYRMKQAERVRPRSRSTATDLLLVDVPEESTLMSRIRDEADADEYKVQDDIMEMCVQFGYLALFGVAWPLVPLGFLLNNWLELRGDFFKLTMECKRPPPVRTDSIGPSLQGLEFLTWLGTLSTATIVHIYRSGVENVKLSSLLLTILAAEQSYLAMRFAVRTTMEKLGSDSILRNEARRYNVRKGYLEAYSKSTAGSSSSRSNQRVRFNERVDVFSTAPDEDPPPNPDDTGHDEKNSDMLHGSQREGKFWSGHQKHTADAGAKLIRALNTRKPAGELKKGK